MRSCQVPLFINKNTNVWLNGAVMVSAILHDWQAYQDAMTTRANE
ncbi:hypothetical protein COMA1_10685 [Candidatus Nitrospira nitrosa]|uniref:Uncharacterized protein n=1 Tax=Candidatus Nitrospira nitrosa TaxID=1742972 RepID=A0A0S4L492_9BACT|nr:hypothetical protein COMA1_10685 [Candidatus Nitrospira nitrosa]